MCRILKNVPHLEKCATLEKLGYNWKIVPHLKNVPRSENSATIGKMSCIWKNAPHLENWATIHR